MSERARGEKRAHEDVVARPDAVGAPPAPRPENGGAAREIPDRRRRRRSAADLDRDRRRGAARRRDVRELGVARERRALERRLLPHGARVGHPERMTGRRADIRQRLGRPRQRRSTPPPPPPPPPPRGNVCHGPTLVQTRSDKWGSRATRGHTRSPDITSSAAAGSVTPHAPARECPHPQGLQGSHLNLS